MTRLADVTRPVGPAFFTPIIRPRVLQRIDEAAAGRVVLIVAPAGYGKSVALSHWLEHQAREFLRFDVLAEHNTLLGFVRGIADTLSPAFPSLSTTIATAAQSSASAAAPGIDMARWVAANVESFEGVFAIDDFHRAADDPEISRFLAALIARTKPRVQWVIATRTALDLPVASWLAYGDANFLVGDRDLTFSDTETHDLSGCAGEPLSEIALREIMEATAGWPVALSLALRSSGVIAGGKNLSTATRDVLFQFLAEQVYAELTAEERQLLHFACYLPEIRIDVLEAAGYRDSARMLEAVRRRATFLALEAPGDYTCHELFREFLRRQVETNDPVAARRLQSEAAKALECVGDSAAALRLYTGQRSATDIVRILCETGFDLMDHAHGDVVESALSVLPQDVRLSNAILLGLRAQRESDLGHFDRAESLFKRAIASSCGNEIRVSLSSRYAVVLMNASLASGQVLETVLPLARQDARAEVLGLLAVERSVRESSERSEHTILQAEAISGSVEDDAARARINLRIAVAGLNVGRPFEQIYQRALTASRIAEQVGLMGLAGRAYSALACIALFGENDLERHMQYAGIAKEYGTRSGDAGVIETSLLQLACAETQRGNSAKLTLLLNELEGKYERSPHVVVRRLLRATQFAWDGDMARAEREMDEYSISGYSYYDFDKVADIAWHSLLCLGAANEAKALKLSERAKAELKSLRKPHIYAEGQYEVARTICKVIDNLTQRNAARIELLRRSQGANSSQLWWAVAASFAPSEPPASRIFCLGGLRRSFVACVSSYARVALARRQPAPALTLAEQRVMMALDAGQTTKEIAAEFGRSVHTIRTLIQRVIMKLECSGRQEALAILRDGNRFERMP